jgi:hypothetical protein
MACHDPGGPKKPDGFAVELLADLIGVNTPL